MSANQLTMLKQTIASIPSNCDAVNDHVGDILHRVLYYGLTNKGEYLPLLFPNFDSSKFPGSYDSLIEHLHEDSTTDTPKFYNVTSSELNHSHKGRPCSRQFKQSEAIYRCLDCGFDETCVLCSYCFNPLDHQDHDVTVSIASATNEGICDCGDPEAWVKELHCNCEEETEVDDSLIIDEKLESSFTETINVVLDYIIEVMLHQNHTIPRVHDSFKASYNLELKIKDASDQSSFTDVLDPNTNEFCLILWNDEFHNYPDATSRIEAVLNCNSQKAQEVASEVDKEGRTILIKSTDINELVSAYYVVQRTGLTATIQSTRDVKKQEIVKYMVSWLHQIINLPILKIQAKLRKVYCELLTSSYDFTTASPPYFLESSEFEANIERHAFKDGLLTDDNKIPRGGLTEFAKNEYEVSSLKNPLTKFLKDSTAPVANSRLQYLLYFDIRFWKRLRKAIHRIITPVLVADLYFKPIFADQFVEIYPHLVNHMANLDREWLLNFLNDATVQLFTCPRTSLSILREGNLVKILSPIIELFENNRSVITDSGDILWKKREINSGADHHARAVWFTQRKSLRDIVQLIEHPSFTADHLCLFETKNIVILIFFIKRFQSNWKIKRKEGEHVVRESTEFTTYFEFNSLISELVKAIGQIVLKTFTPGVFETDNHVENAILILNNYLQLHHSKEKWIENGDFNIIDFKVSKQEVGFMNPLNSLLSYLIEFLKVTDFNLLNKKVITFSVDNVATADSYSDFLKVSDVSLRALVLCSQIKMGFWVRNGVLVGRQEALYRSSLLSESGLFRDIHLQQVSIIVEPSLKRSLFNFLDRYDILNWFLNNEELEKSAYEDKVFYAFEEFITFLYNIYVYRLSFKFEYSEEEKEEIKMRNLISYALCQGLCSYSQLSENFPNEVVARLNFEKILEELSEYKPPQSLNDTGLYRLKPAVFETLDPLSIFVDPSNVPEIAGAIKHELAKAKKTKSDEIVLKPEIIKLDLKVSSFKKIDEFFRTKNFAKLLYKLFQTAIDTDNESYLPVLLHLLHAIVLDDQFEDDQHNSLESFIDIPIPNLLLTISESTTIAKSNVKKADHILDLFVLKNESVINTLKECFGEEHINSYKQLKAENGGGFETREERKKRLAKERLLKIKRRFERQQNKFAAKNEVNLKPKVEQDSEGDIKMADESDSKTESSLRSCIICQTEESNNEVFGYSCYVNKSAVFWQLPVKNPAYDKLAFNDWSNQRLSDEAENKKIDEDTINKKRKRTDSHGSSVVSNNTYMESADDDEEEEDEDEDDTGVLDHEFDSSSDGETHDLERDPIEVMFDEQFIDDYGNVLPQGPHGLHNYISSHRTSRRESVSSNIDSVVSFGKNVSPRYVASSCGHGMHYRCFKQYVKKPSSFNLGFQCPLCRSLNNLFMPSFIRPETNSIQFKGDLTAFKYNQIVSETDGLNSDYFAKELVNPEFLNLVNSDTAAGRDVLADITQIFKENEVLEYIYSDATNFFANIQSLSILIGNTIQMNEITSRNLTKSENMNTIEVLQSQSLLILSMIQTRSLIGLLSRKLIDPKTLISIECDNLWQERFLNTGIFTEFIMLVFQCKQSVQTLARLASTKLFTTVVDSVLERCSYDEAFLTLICKNGIDKSENLTSLKNFIIDEVNPSRTFAPEVLEMVVNYDPPASNKFTNSFMIGLQYAICRLMLPFYRQLFTFCKIFDQDFKLDQKDNNSSLNSLIRSQINSICDFIGCETFSDLPDVLLVRSKELESNVFDNILRSKIPKFYEEGSLTLDYPGVIKLIDLPSHLNSFLKMNGDSRSGLQLQYSLCLLCGEKVPIKSVAGLSHRVIKHFHNECERSAGLLCILLNPFNNVLSVILQLQTTQSAIAALQGRSDKGKVFRYVLPSPYLNKHGESNFRGGSFNGVLNEHRYDELNKLWLNQGIYAFLSRIAMDWRNIPAFTGVDPFTTDTFVPMDEEEDDEGMLGLRWD